jgi:hypothetical protein
LTDHLVFPSAAHVVVAIVLFLGGVAWLISIRPPHDFGGDAHARRTERASLEKKPIASNWSVYRVGLESAATAQTPDAGAGTRLTLILSIK